LKLAIRTDSSNIIGTGHIIRCISLAKEFRKLGVKVYFISKPYKGNILKVVKKNKFYIKTIKTNLNISKDADKTIKILKKLKIGLLIADSYTLNFDWEKKVKKHVKKLIVINDLIKKTCCDVLINSNFLPDKLNSFKHLYKKKIIKETKILLGSKYAVLDSKYYKLKKKIKPKKKIGKINIFFGGFQDSLNLIENAVDALSDKKLRQIKLDIVIGLNQKLSKRIIFKLTQRGNFKIFKNLSTLANLFKKADLGIGCGGVANSERLCLGLPSLVFIAAKNQETLGEELSKKRIIIRLKMKKKEIDKKHLSNLVYKLKENKNLLNTMSKRGRLIVDGFGAKRIANSVLNINKNKIKLL